MNVGIDRYVRAGMRWLAERKRWRRPVSKDAVRVYYGFDRLPSSDDVGGGGIVKVHDLTKLYPNSVNDANTLYFISSSLPENATIIVDNAARCGARLVWNQNGVGYPAWDPSGWSLTNETFKGMLCRASFVVYQSLFCKRAADHFLVSPPCEWDILHNPVDTNVFVPAECEVMNPGPVLLVGGTHTDWYRVEVALHVIARLCKVLPGVKLIVAGKHVWIENEIEARERTMKCAMELGIAAAVECRGGYTPSGAVRLMQEAHILLHTKQMDACPRLVVEAMACGLPIVCTHSGGLSELIGTTAGIAVPIEESWDRVIPVDAGALAESVCVIWKNYSSVAEAARKRAVEQFDVRPWTRRHTEIFEYLLRS